MVNRRNLLKLSTFAIGGAAASSGLAAMLSSAASAADSSSVDALTLDSDVKSVVKAAKPITKTERLARIAKAQDLMQQQGIDAMILEPGAAMVYFSGMNWWRSERLTCVIIPAKGNVSVVTPFFEEASVRESLQIGDDVRTWHEHDDPFAKVKEILTEAGIANGRVALEDSVRYFVVDGLKRQNIMADRVSAYSVSSACRMIKTKAELKLMQTANMVVLKAYEHVIQSIKEGQTPADIVGMMKSAMSKLGGSRPWALALVGQASAYPHGSDQPQIVKDGEIILMDCGCAVQGYQADISRSFVFGQPTQDQRDMWDLMSEGQKVVMKAAQIGVPAGYVDDAVRVLYEKHGYGPDYAMPGLPHRTGHGIGMEGHEPINFVRGEKTPLAAGMCFSNEPGLYDFARFGVRIEDCLYMTDHGPQYFTLPPETIDKPLGKMAKIII